MLTLIGLVAVSFVIAALAAIAVSSLFRQRRKRLLGLQRAVQLRRSAEHIHLVAQACHYHTGNAAIGRVLLQLAIRTLEEAHALAPQDAELERLLSEYQEQEARNTTAVPQTPASDLSENEAALSRARLLLTEALRLLSQIERDGWVPAAEIRQMRDNVQQARRATELRLRLRHAAQAEPVAASASRPTPEEQTAPLPDSKPLAH
ncbi:MAG: hypothetical protein RBS88_01025 [Spongiibacteraceae bacterium]|nr:hypothetical protein [Spongiibacteraceae bacterium]